MAINTIQSGIKHHTKNSLWDYSLFLGGLNVTNDVLTCYDPLTGGYGRLFMVRKPLVIDRLIPDQTKKFKHILEYGNTAVSGINDVSVSFNTITGGYTGKSFDIPSIATDDTNRFTVQCYEFSGSPIRETIHTWINSAIDLQSGLCHFSGLDADVERSQANQTAEFIYVATDKTGENVEYACLLANCFPTGIKNDHWNYQSGEHQLVEYSVEFTCTKYESLQINKVAIALIDRYKILANSLNFYSGITIDDNTLGTAKSYDIATGKLIDKANSSNKGMESVPVSETDAQMMGQL